VGSAYKNMKELRPGSRGRSEIRVLFAFDPRRRALLLVAGDKAGNWKKWYSTNIPIADARYAEHLKRRPVDEKRVAAIESEIRQEIRAVRLREIRAAYAITQTALARQLKVSQNRVSRIERGDIDRTQLETLRRYIEALGGELTIEATFGSERYVLTTQ